MNPHRSAREQVDFINARNAHAEYALSQIVSHHSVDIVEDFLEEADRAGSTKPVVFGVFYYRSSNPRTLSTLGSFFPVPSEEIQAEFEAGASPEEICARSIRALRSAGAEKIYVSNLSERHAGRRLRSILELV